MISHCNYCHWDYVHSLKNPITLFFFVFLSFVDVSAITCIMEPWTENGHHQKNTENVENSMYNYHAWIIYLARTWAYTEPDNEELEQPSGLHVVCGSYHPRAHITCNGWICNPFLVTKLGNNQLSKIMPTQQKYHAITNSAITKKPIYLFLVAKLF